MRVVVFFSTPKRSHIVDIPGKGTAHRLLRVCLTSPERPTSRRFHPPVCTYHTVPNKQKKTGCTLELIYTH